MWTDMALAIGYFKSWGVLVVVVSGCDDDNERRQAVTPPFGCQKLRQECCLTVQSAKLKLQG